METPPSMLILFDGVCNLCNGSVQFILKRDKQGRFRFASLQSDYGQAILHKFGLPAGQLNSFIFIENEKLFTRSTAALRVLKNLGGGWSLLYIFRIIPTFIRDGIYDWVSRNRYRWFGKQESCMLPKPEWKDRFLPPEQRS